MIGSSWLMWPPSAHTLRSASREAGLVSRTMTESVDLGWEAAMPARAGAALVGGEILLAPAVATSYSVTMRGAQRGRPCRPAPGATRAGPRLRAAAGPRSPGRRAGPGTGHRADDCPDGGTPS